MRRGYSRESARLAANLDCPQFFTTMPERSSNRLISSDQRNAGTLQVSRWHFRGPINRNRLFVVVTRQDSPWSTVTDQAESYGLVIVLDDRHHAEVNLYGEVRAMLQARVRARLQV